MTDLDMTRAAYDTVAADYADVLRDELAGKPLDRALLAVFAEQVGAGALVADLGCGPGRITAHLRDLGLDAFGVDLSPGMVAVARRDHPGLRFEVGDLAALDIADSALAGAVAWYSVIHTATPRLPAVFAELRRVLRPGGHLLMAFQAGDEVRHVDEAYGHPVSADVHCRPPDLVARLLAEAGIETWSTTVRAPGAAFDRGPQAYLLARRT
jgi:SAM-dependent methyltransferase